MSKPNRVTVTIHGQTFHLQAEPKEKATLLRVADLVSEKMKQLSQSSSIGLHRVAIMTAFHFAYELFHLQQQPGGRTMRASKSIDKKLDNLIGEIEKALKE
jgi:cell division protein ZapA (FtsZ GTPase activity inhibitor)